jgi:predicted dehydrogenase
MGSIRTACVGTGYFSQFHLDAWRRIEGIELVASASLDFAAAKKTGLPAFKNVNAMLAEAKPELVDIITPSDSHLELIRSCLSRDVKTIICQKPFCNSLEEAMLATELCEQAGVNLIIHENFRFQPWYRCMKRVMEDELLGQVHQLTFRLRTGDGQGDKAYLDRQPYFQKMPRFLIHETGVHWIDTFRFLFGKPLSVYADLRQLNPAIAGEDAGYFIMEFAQERRALFDANRHLDHDAENCRTTLGEALLEGSKGTISLEGTGRVRFRSFGSRTPRTLIPIREYAGFAGDCVFALQSHVVNAIRGDGKFENSAHDYLDVLKIEEAIYKSAESGQKVCL